MIAKLLRLVVVTGAAALLIGCVSVRKAPSALDAPDTSSIIRVIGRFSSAHACPVAADIAFTAAHVTDLRPFDPSIPAWPYRFEGGGAVGVMKPARVLGAADLAVMRPGRAFERWYELAEQAPQSGDRLWLLAYDWRAMKSMYADRVVSGRVLRIVAGNIVLDEEVPRGASGSCVLNAASEVVGVVTWGHGAEDGNAVGVVAAVYGEWWDGIWEQVVVEETPE